MSPGQEAPTKVVIPISSSLEADVRDLSKRCRTSPERFVSDALNEYVRSFGRRMYQVSTATALVEGVYAGSVPSSILLRHGDFGLGTFPGLDGEMIILEGETYQAAGSVQRRSDFLVPFASITHFNEDAVFDVGMISCLKDIEAACDRHRKSDNLFYAFRVDGVFDRVRARAVHPVPEGTRLLDAARTELEFQFPNIEGTLVCLWSPKYSSAFSVPGYHFHFISNDRTKGGHVLDCNARRLRANADRI